MSKLRINGVEMHALDRGSGVTVLFVHGFPLDHTMWQAQLDELAKTHRVIAPDLRGFGHSAVTQGTVSMEQFADDLDALLGALRVGEPVVLCGLSMGGYIAFQFVRRHGQRLRALILCDTRAAADAPINAAGRHELAKKIVEEGSRTAITTMLPKLLAEQTRAERPEIVGQLSATIAATNPHGMAAALRGMAERSDSTSLLPDIRVPALLVCGREDSLTPPDEMRKMSDMMPHAKFVEIPEAGHMAPLENPAAVNTALREFLDALPADGDSQTT